MNTLKYLLPHAICTGIYASLLTGLFAAAALQVLLLLFRNARSFYKYHVGNMAMLACLTSFLAPFRVLIERPHSDTTFNVIPITYTPVTAVPVPSYQTAPVPLSKNIWFVISHQLNQWNTVIFILYITGLLLFSVKLLPGWYHLRKLKNTAAEMPENVWNHYLDDVLKKMNISRKVIIRYSSDVLSPCITGYTKAMILVPISLCSRLSAEQAEAVLMHELAHLKHSDYFWNILTQAINALLFFNPFVWFITRKCAQYREYACDEVVKEYNRETALGESLLAIAQYRNSHSTIPALSLYNSNQKQLLNRVQNLLSMKKTTRTAAPSWAFTLLLSLGLICVMPSSSISQAQNTDILDVAIKRAFQNGNEYFILLQAIKDKLVSEDRDYNLAYEKDTVYINDKMVDEPFQSEYVTLLKGFYASQGCGQTYFSLRGGNISKGDIIDPDSYVQRKPVPSPLIATGDSRNMVDFLKAEMVRDGIADTTKSLEIRYDMNGVFVNGKKLKRKPQEKYRYLFKVLGGIDPKGPHDSFMSSSGPSPKNAN